MATDVSVVSSAKRAHTSGAIWLFTNTVWQTPVPSRSSAKAILPDERTWVTHARTVTDWPTCVGKSARRANGAAVAVGMLRMSGEWRADGVTSRIPEQERHTREAAGVAH